MEPSRGLTGSRTTSGKRKPLIIDEIGTWNIVASRALASGQTGPAVPVHPSFIVRLALAHQVKPSPSGWDNALNGISRFTRAETFGGSAGSNPRTLVGVYTHQLPVTSNP